MQLQSLPFLVQIGNLFTLTMVWNLTSNLLLTIGIQRTHLLAPQFLSEEQWRLQSANASWATPRGPWLGWIESESSITTGQSIISVVHSHDAVLRHSPNLPLWLDDCGGHILSQYQSPSRHTYNHWSLVFLDCGWVKFRGGKSQPTVLITWFKRLMYRRLASKRHQIDNH